MKRIVVLLALALLFSQSDAQLKKRIAVGVFEDRSGSGYNHLGSGVADMLTTALFKTGKFLVVERGELDRILSEQKLGESGLVTPESAPKVGKLLGAELFVIGSVTECGTKENNIGGNIPLFGGSVTKKTARTVVDVRLVNTTTGEIVAAEKKEGSESTTGVAVRYERIDFNNTSSWNDTDIGKATREAIEGVIELISDNLAKIPWSGKILKVNSDGTLLMKPGSEGNVKIGDEFDIFRQGEDIKDPDTGQSLGAEETKIGHVKVTDDALKGKAAKAKIVEGKDIQANDIIREAK
ncbi:MAG: CsgG/HfaB family protein [Bacteroidota bacterium]|nr:CsgG/HfaB family protein [Bacteroidota bacterium]